MDKINTNHKSKISFEIDKVNYLQCCDCGLVHGFSYSVINGKITITLTREDEMTQQERKLSLCDMLDEAIRRETDSQLQSIQI